MRLTLTTLAAILLLCAPALAGGAYDEVPFDHWAYDALDYLTCRGVLEGYPDGFFIGDRTLTRYEFAQAVARLLDTVGEGSPESVNIMAETLRAEFSDQLIALWYEPIYTPPLPIHTPLLNCNGPEVDQRACQLLERLQDRGYPGLLANLGISTPRSISHEELLVVVAAALEETALDNSRVVKRVREVLENAFGEELAMLPQDTARMVRR